MTNRTLLLKTGGAVRAFADGRASLEELQAKLQSVMTLLERADDAAEAAMVMGNVEGDLEFIRFTIFGGEIHPAVNAALEPLLPYLPEPAPKAE